MIMLGEIIEVGKNVSEFPPPPSPAHQLFQDLRDLAAAVVSNFALPNETPWHAPVCKTLKWAIYISKNSPLAPMCKGSLL